MNFFNRAIILVGILFLWACQNDDAISPILDLSNKVSELTGTSLSDASKDEVKEIEWKCTNWDTKFYKGTEEVGTWDGYSKTISDSEKNQVYRITDDTFSVANAEPLKTSGDTINYHCQWDEDGTITIDKVVFLLKKEQEHLVLFFDTKDAISVAKIFNVSIDNTFGGDLNKHELEGLGIIKFKKHAFINKQIEEIEANLLIQSFHDKDLLFETVYKTISINTNSSIFTLDDAENNSTTLVSLSNEEINLSSVNPQRAQTLFTHFLKASPFNFEDISIKIDTISHKENTSNGFIVKGASIESNERLSFYMNTASEEEYWINEPINTTHTISALDLVQGFIDRTPLLGYTFNFLNNTGTAFKYRLEGSEEDLAIREVNILNENVDLSQLSNKNAIALFSAFLKAESYTFNSYNLSLSNISHDDDKDGGFIVNGNITETYESISFYYNINTQEESWILPPRAFKEEISANDLFNNFNKRLSISGGVFDNMGWSESNTTFTINSNTITQSRRITVSDDVINLSNLSPERAKTLFTAFANRSHFTFDNTSIITDSISHKDETGGSLIVYGTTLTENQVSFYYNTNDEEEYWIVAPN
ncbi:hypothetical protein [Saccharicrinis aurantiacus]|uniref:hypothetical protein n=1 Tax=Saccharicrinis aurantiacus TaxID=1849719 RepID=UPI00249252C9|nr:hypothetical protein [Saccharicrinis aurantiacus]